MGNTRSACLLLLALAACGPDEDGAAFAGAIPREAEMRVSIH